MLEYFLHSEILQVMILLQLLCLLRGVMYNE